MTLSSLRDGLAKLLAIALLLLVGSLPFGLFGIYSAAKMIVESNLYGFILSLIFVLFAALCFWEALLIHKAERNIQT